MLEFVVAWLAGEVIGIFAHEGGHALAAWLMGFRLREVVVGQGQVVYSTQCGRAKIEIRAKPLGGKTSVFPEIYLRKLPDQFFTLGGVLANSLLLFGALFLLRSPPGRLEHAIEGFIYAQAFLIIWNLIPREFTINGATIPSDGRRLAHLWKQKDGSLTPLAGCYLRSLAEYTDNDPITALSPASTRVLLLHHSLHHGVLDGQAHADALRTLAAELEQGNFSLEEGIMLLDTLVTEAVVRGNADARASMDGWSARAMTSGAHIRTIKFSRAAVLVELGRFAEGKALIEMSRAPDDRAYDTLLNNIFLARAEAGLGNHARAEELLADAGAQLAADAHEAKWIREQGLLDRIREAIRGEKAGREVYQD